ncbi:probable ATP-dependent DNA helicase HFM1 [Anopheles cruzii]|uniref:probable ATP-dependent DNA helicase HFM1 n=1 Tax=Anopheles cruzii TaxID=68878 RepID=UPI0022EC40F8|nr:probable ATP-dependent DNA helicase HFM1 [Anopheles cruzii]
MAQSVDTQGRPLSLADLPPDAREVFRNLKSFNKVQTAVAATILQSTDSLVVNAPTGSGKTVILELAIVRLALASRDNYRIVYLAPTRSLCAEKYHDWKDRLGALRISCIQYDGDNAVEDINKLSNHRLILSTPEKWEVFTRNWADRNVANVLRHIKLFLIDEVQVMEDSERGANLELVVGRMKLIDARMNRDQLANDGVDPAPTLDSIRFIAVSACVPNVDDFARWLQNDRHVAAFSFDETDRQTTLERHVLGYPCHAGAYKFELNLNYKLVDIITKYACEKPTLIFCSSRKSAETTASFLAREMQIKRGPLPPGGTASGMAGKHLQDLVARGVAYHHAGLLASDRTRIESSFRSGHIAILCCTSTLCMGVNLPAYLVIIKSTFSYTGKDYSNNYLLQMMGRAGRSEFNEHGVAVIMTTESNVDRYRKLAANMLPTESQLHNKLPELLNSEIAYGMIYDRPAVHEWIKSTFFYVRASANPSHYQLSGGRPVDEQIEELCQSTLESLQTSGLIVARRPDVLQPSGCGKLMARNHMSFATTKLLLSELTGRETLQEMLSLVCRADEFSSFKCRMNEKRILNSLNSSESPSAPDSSDGAGIRFRWPGRISTTGAKVYCLVQAVFGCLPINDHGLHQEAAKIITLGARISRCIIGLLNSNRDRFGTGSFRALRSAATLSQCFQAKLWENSPLISRQLAQIGPRLAQHLAERGKNSFQTIRATDPRELEWIVKKQPPFGNELISFVNQLPEFCIELTKAPSEGSEGSAEFSCTVYQRNGSYRAVAPESSVIFSVLVGDSSNRTLLYHDGCSAESIPAEGCTWPIHAYGGSVDSITAQLICGTWVGLDCIHTARLSDRHESIATKQTTITHFFPSRMANDTMDVSFGPIGPV